AGDGEALLPAGDLPERQLVPCGGEQLAIGGERDVDWPVGVLPERAPLLACRRVPQPDDVVTPAGGESLAVGGQRQGHYAPRMRLRLPAFLPPAWVPQPQLALPTPGNQPVPVRCEG